MGGILTSPRPEKVAVVGGGISGLAAAYFALRKGYAVELHEETGEIGGLAASFDFQGLMIEKYYHFICGGDVSLLKFSRELGLGDKIRFRPTKTAFFHHGRYYPFATALDLIRFTPIAPFARIKFGLNFIKSKYLKAWAELDQISAKDWLCRTLGQKAYEVIWRPLLRVKFGEDEERISAAWIWQRIHRVASSRQSVFSREKMGYFVGGSRTLLSEIERTLKALGGGIWLNSGVQRISREDGKFKLMLRRGCRSGFDRVILAVPLPVAAQIIYDLNPDYAHQLAATKFIGISCGIFRLRRSVTPAFWLNINDPRIPTNGFIEYTNLNPIEEIWPDRIVYIPFYVPVDHRWYVMDEEAIKTEFLDMIRIVNPKVSPEAVVGFQVFRSPYAQAVCPLGFKKNVLQVRTPVRGLFLLDSTQLYPSDRVLSGLIGLTEKTVAEHF